MPSRLRQTRPSLFVRGRTQRDIHIEVRINSSATSSRSPGVKECYWRFVWKGARESKVEKEWCIFVGRVFGSENQDPQYIETRFVSSDENALYD